MPENLTGVKAPHIPLWAQMIQQKWPSFVLVEADEKAYGLLSVQIPAEISSLRAAAKATVAAVMAGIKAIRPDVSQRSVEAAVTYTPAGTRARMARLSGLGLCLARIWRVSAALLFQTPGTTI